MRDFLDVSGASGATYRFRALSSLGEPPQTAGNFVVLDAAAGEARVVCAGTAKSLASLTSALGERRGGAAARTFVRLNVARSTREEEHADIARRHAPSEEMLELD